MVSIPPQQAAPIPMTIDVTEGMNTTPTTYKKQQVINHPVKH